MSVPVLTFFNIKARVGRTSLVFHLAWMLSEMGRKVVAIDLDPQANLTSAFLPDEVLEEIWDPDTPVGGGTTIYQCVRPLLRGGDILPSQTREVAPNLHLVPGDLALGGIEMWLSAEWVKAGSNCEDPCRSLRILSSLWQVGQMAARAHGADIILADTGPNLGYINGSALVGTNYVVLPLPTDRSMTSTLHLLGSTLREWHGEWQHLKGRCQGPDKGLPDSAPIPLGYVLMPYLDGRFRKLNSNHCSAAEIRQAYQEFLLSFPLSSAQPSEQCLAEIKLNTSLAAIAQDAHKPMFKLSAADGAMGALAVAARNADSEYRHLATEVAQRMAILDW